MIRHLALGFILASTWSVAHADFLILPPTKPGPVVKPTIPGPVTGPQAATAAPTSVAAPHAAPVQRAAGSTLRDTLRKIVPTGWKAFSDKGLNAETHVEYAPSLDWQASLATLATRYNLVFKVDPEKKTVFVDQGPGGMRDTEADNRNLANSNFGPEKTPPTMTADGKLRFEIKDGQRLSDAVRQFLQAGKWDLAWEAGSDIEVSKGFVVIDADLRNVLTRTLSKFNMNATLHKGNYIAVVRSNTAE